MACGTIQVDMNLPQRFDISYIGEDGEKHQPVMRTGALFGSIERFLGILIEHHAGKRPLWLSPEQVVVMPVTSAFDNYAEEVAKTLRAAGLTPKPTSATKKSTIRFANTRSRKSRSLWLSVPRKRRTRR